MGAVELTGEGGRGRLALVPDPDSPDAVFERVRLRALYAIGLGGPGAQF